MMNEFTSKRWQSSGWRYDRRESPDRREVFQGENVDFICWYLYNNPGARYTEVLRALCTRNRTEYHRGQYSNYFNSGSGSNGHVGKLWSRVGPGWMLTLDGMVRYGNWCA